MSEGEDARERVDARERARRSPSGGRVGVPRQCRGSSLSLSGSSSLWLSFWLSRWLSLALAFKGGSSATVSRKLSRSLSLPASLSFLLSHSLAVSLFEEGEYHNSVEEVPQGGDKLPEPVGDDVNDKLRSNPSQHVGQH